MAVPLGTIEYIIMLATFLFLYVAFFVFFLIKWIKDKFSLGIFEIFGLLSQIFCLSRVVVLGYLLYLRYGFFPMVKASGDGPNGKTLLTVGNYLALLWELIYLGGLCLLFTLTSMTFYKSRVIKLGEQHFRDTLGFTTIYNIVVYVVTIALVAIQIFNLNDEDSLWVHLGYVWVSVNMVLIAVFSSITTNDIVSSIARREIKSESNLLLAQHAVVVRVCNTVTTVCLFIRALAVSVDAFSYKFIPHGTGIQVMWNVFFKYVLWVIPEILSLLCMSFAMNRKEKIIKIIALMLSGKKISSEELRIVAGDNAQDPSGYAPLATNEDAVDEFIESQKKTGAITEVDDEGAPSSTGFVKMES